MESGRFFLFGYWSITSKRQKKYFFCTIFKNMFYLCAIVTLSKDIG